MTNDTYVKTVLTVIAGSLVWLCAMHAGRPLSAQQPAAQSQGAQPVVIVGWGTLDERGRVSVTMVEDRQRGGRRSDPNLPVMVVKLPPAPIDVRLPYTDTAPMPVGVTRIKPAGEWEPIRSAAEPEPTRPRPGGR